MIIDLQRRIAEIGRIRIGQQVPTGNGSKTRPEKLTTFRLTSADKVRIDTAAQLFGGTPQSWAAPAGPQWEVITQADVLDVIVPPSDMAFSQHYELWSAGGCLRRCDGRSESISDGPCVCDADSRECSIHTRLSVMVRDLPGLGVWRIDTSGYYAAVELQGAVQVIQIAAGQGQMLPARLRLEQRQVKRIVDGKPQTRRFAVPVLDVEVTMGLLMASAASHQEVERNGTAQIDGTARLTPVPAALSMGPTQTIAQQVAAVDDPAPPAKRANSAQPLPATGLQPRTAADAATDAVAIGGITDPQMRKMGALMHEAGITDRESRLQYVADVVGHEVGTSKELTVSEASAVLDALVALTVSSVPVEDPPADPWASEGVSR